MQIEYVKPYQSPLGSVTPAAKIQLVAGSVRLLAVDLSFADSGGSCYVQLHDVLAAGSISDATMVMPFGVPVDGTTQLIQLLSWGPDAWLFQTAVTLAASSTRYTYTASTVKFVAKGRWL